MPPALGRDLTAWAAEGRLEPLVGREREVDQVLRILCRRTKSNPLLLGEPGVGKTALVEGIAQLIAQDRVPPPLRGRPLFELQLGSLLAGTQYRGDLEKRVEGFLEAARRGSWLVFVDEIHLLVAAGRGSGMDAANLLKPMLSRGGVPCLGATTATEAAEMFRVDPALERRFQPVFLAEPDREGVRTILRSARARLEQHHRLVITDEAIDLAVELSLARGGTRRNPDRALDLLEDACAAEQLRTSRTAALATETSAKLTAYRETVEAAAQRLDLEAHVRAREALEAAEKQANAPRAPACEPVSRVDEEHVREAATPVH